MNIAFAAITVVLGAAAGAFASYIQTRLQKRDEIFLQKIEQTYSSTQDYISNLTSVFLNMENTLHGGLSLSQYYEQVSVPSANVRAYRDMKMYMELYFPGLLEPMATMYESRGRLVKIFQQSERILKRGGMVDQSARSAFAAEVQKLQQLEKQLLEAIAGEARRRFARGFNLKSVQRTP